jgi:hypothetical protein
MTRAFPICTQCARPRLQQPVQSRDLPGNVRSHYSRAILAFTFVELMVASALGTVLVALLLVLTLYGQQSFGLMTGYSELDSKTRNAVTLLSKEVRESTRVLDAQSSSALKSLTLTNAIDSVTVKLVWDAAERTLTIQKNPGATGTLLTGCDSWDYALYDGAPIITGGKVSFSPSASPTTCKLVQMSWSCSRTVLGKTTASSVESVRFGLRNNF